MVSMKYDSNKGPKTKPIIPKTGMPIITPITVMTGCVSATRLAISSRSTLSILVITIKPINKIPKPEAVFPFASSIKAAGTNTIGAPTTGRKERKVEITPQNIGSRIPKKKNVILTNAP